MVVAEGWPDKVFARYVKMRGRKILYQIQHSFSSLLHKKLIVGFFFSRIDINRIVGLLDRLGGIYKKWVHYLY